MRVLLLILCFASFSYADEFSWHQVEKGYSIGRYSIGEKKYIFSSEVLILKFSPQYFKFAAITSRSLGEKRSDVKSLTEFSSGVAGINANFFDVLENALGLVINNNIVMNKAHQGGNLLSGIFLIDQDKAHIIHKGQISQYQPSVAVQAGPRLIADGQALKVKDPQTRSRRSGVAITNDGEVLIFATLLRFPGASFEEIQKMLTDLKVKDALNFDGGGSSQLYVQKNSALTDDILISGGDTIPVALVVKKR